MKRDLFVDWMGALMVGTLVSWFAILFAHGGR